MSSPSVTFFDRLAASYDLVWTSSAVGRMQRSAVWRELDRRVRPKDRLLDLGCGTGEDALHFSQAGAVVSAIDGSIGMVDAALRKGVDARLLRIEQIDEFLGPNDGAYDLVLSNFGALNCVRDLAMLREPLARLVRPGGSLAICVMNRFCLWEFVHYAVRGQFRKAARRWRGESVASGGLDVYYPSLRSIKDALSPIFRLTRDVGIGVSVPPSYVRGLPAWLLGAFDAVDARIARSKIGRAIGDHRLLIFAR